MLCLIPPTVFIVVAYIQSLEEAGDLLYYLPTCVSTVCTYEGIQERTGYSNLLDGSKSE